MAYIWTAVGGAIKTNESKRMNEILASPRATTGIGQWSQWATNSHVVVVKREQCDE